MESYVRDFKNKKAIIFIIALGALIGFIVKFGKDLITLCDWLSLCLPGTQLMVAPDIDIDFNKAYLERPDILGSPIKSWTGSFIRYDHEDIPIYNEVYMYKKDNLIYEIEYGNYIRVYRDKGPKNDENCITNVATFHGFSDIFDEDKILCLGESTFSDFIDKDYYFNGFPEDVCVGKRNTGGSSPTSWFTSVTCKNEYNDTTAGRGEPKFNFKLLTYGENPGYSFCNKVGMPSGDEVYNLDRWELNDKYCVARVGSKVFRSEIGDLPVEVITFYAVEDR